MPKMHVNKSISINAPVDKIYQTLSDFNHWAAWSPWLIMEPGAEVNVSENKKSYSWDGKIVGSGNMKITAEKNNESIDYDLTFLKPWKSTAKVRFEMKPNGEGVNVNWSMDSGIPFFLFWMKKMMTAFIGMDYERGLRMLKEYVEEGKTNSKLEIKGVSSFEGCSFVGINTDTKMDALSTQMKSDFEKIGELAHANPDVVAGPPFSIYHKWDMVNRNVSYTSGIPVKKVPDALPAGMISGNIPPTSVYSVEHTGPYIHLGNAWSALYSMQRAKVFKVNKKVNPFEVYISDPGKVEDNDLKTVIHFPIK